MIIYDDVIIFLHFLNDLSQQSNKNLHVECRDWSQIVQVGSFPLSPFLQGFGAAKEPMIAMIALINSLKEK